MGVQRVKYLDLAKFFAILLVCIGHACKIFEDEVSNETYKLIYSFHMPLFMVLSGIFAERAFGLGFVEFLKKKTTQLLVPAFAVIVLVCTGYLVFSNTPTFSFLTTELVGGMWFLKCLFACYLLCYLFQKITSKFWLMILLSGVVVFVIPAGDFLRINYFYLCFVTGMILKKYQALYTKHIGIVTTVALCYFCCFGIIGEPPKFVQYDYKSFLELPRFLASGLSGSFVIIGISYYLECFVKWGVVSKCCIVGKYTLGIYCLQTVILERGLYEILYPIMGNTFLTFVGCISIGGIICLLCYLISLLFEKNRITRFLFIGR